MKLNKLQLALIASGVLASSAHTLAAGFQLTNHSASGLGRAYAGDAAIADNAAVISRNPAAMAMFDSPEFSGGVNVIIPDTNKTNVKYDNGVTATQDIMDGKDLSSTSYVPALYYIHPINNKFAVGLSAYSDFGTTVGFSDEFNAEGSMLTPAGFQDGAAGLFGGTTEVSTFTLGVSGSYRINEMFSLGASLKALKGEGTFKRPGPDLSAFGAGQLGLDFEGDGYAFAWDVGALLELNERNRFGLSYKSGIDFKADSSHSSYINQAGAPTTINSLELSLPSIVEFSGYHLVAPKWAVHYSAMHVGWSSFDKIDFNLDDGTVYPKTYGWDDSWRLSLGTTYYLNEKLTLRAGIAKDESPISQDKRVISIPDSDRMWYSVGGTYAFNQASSLDLALAYIDGKTIDVSESQDNIGTMTATSKTSAWIVGVQYNHKF
ncbi:hypothetical protein DBZ36_04145 [Alginatibacterium sediminis]|uniref:Aromatic hydrocarbon degradation protein n=1 Tax=Alginatibacterium sediminis TaxID=2164068 RepID=A0A420EGI1_9ALTE|nr:outer membrane protein transport protein [Alginatibacterium sediminis]RKF19666.1 hypothetical protein DBZ36_04145 [Alginatibacterium sediminis]